MIGVGAEPAAHTWQRFSLFGCVCAETFCRPLVCVSVDHFGLRLLPSYHWDQIVYFCNFGRRPGQPYTRGRDESESLPTLCTFPPCYLPPHFSMRRLVYQSAAACVGIIFASDGPRRTSGTHGRAVCLNIALALRRSARPSHPTLALFVLKGNTQIVLK